MRPWSRRVSEKAQNPSTSTEMPVTVLVECRQTRVGQWATDQWEAVAVVAGEDVSTTRSTTMLVHEDEQCRRYLWSGLTLALYRDACEAYWYNLMSGKPYLYVICHVDEDEDGAESLIPALVTADQQEASGHMETDDQVYSVRMPERVHQWLERFVVENYVPEEKKKRKRKQWAEESEHAETSERPATPSARH